MSSWPWLLVVLALCPRATLPTWHWHHARIFPPAMWHHPPPHPHQQPQFVPPHMNSGIQHQFHPHHGFRNPTSNYPTSNYPPVAVSYQEPKWSEPQKLLWERTGPILKNVSTSLRISGRRSNDELFSYRAPPSYNRINGPPQSIWKASSSKSSYWLGQPSSQNLDISPSVPGVVKLSPMSNVNFPLPQANWASTVAFKVSLRPDAWTKATRPSMTEEMKRFLPELKYYEKGLKPIDTSKVKTTVEKFVLVSKKKRKEEDFPTGDSALPLSKDTRLLSDRPFHEGREPPVVKPHEPKVVLESWSPLIEQNIEENALEIERDTKEPAKAIKDIVAESFATTTPTPEDLDEATSEELKKLSEMFDIVYVRNRNSSFSSPLKSNSSREDGDPIPNEETKQIEHSQAEKLSSLDSVILRMAGLPPDFHSKTNVADTQLLETASQVAPSSPVVQNATTAFESQRIGTKTHETSTTSGDLLIGSSSLWSSPVIVTSSTMRDVAWTTEDVRKQVDTSSSPPKNLVDPLLEFLGLSWPPVLLTSSESPHTSVNTSQTPGIFWEKRVGIGTHNAPSPSTAQVLEQDDNAISSHRDTGENWALELSNRVSRHHHHHQHQHQNFPEIPLSSETETPEGKLPPQLLEFMFSAMGHGIKQVMAIVSPLVKMKNPSVFNGSFT